MARKSSASNDNLSSEPSLQMDDARRAVLEKALGDIVKRYGEGAIMRMGEAQQMEIAAIPTGSLSLDIALGVGGIPRGRITEIYGPESSGKTTLCLHVVAETQNSGGTAAYIDMEHALDPVYAARIGVNVNDLLVSQPDTGEQALEIAETLVRSGAVDLVVVDSVAALVPRSEIEGDMGDATMGMQARLMSQALRKLSGAIHQTKTSVIFTNQLRQKIGVMFGNPETTTGVLAVKKFTLRYAWISPH
jgi:recombination protein RecA